ncbi:MAG: TetR/AcrR family transcriptional regulator [Candidatus Marinimicrobia bacterium]|jgi:AcrR family transcriptional regulator|nr:TetR/AcrR family transcriptional regulator [Candidatus Neomarinimicrobiota bacterium]MBT3501315.1 TetR/AcrR family transcriptional regulator [Candidatus Neomarinimicrobiota bacterium]MBT3838515.1 TetR/AcrR family transcriptional regulator [Candidatus Neomarinimicrobiota bacterium]MBT3999897.1 TetR/AcrR family transcriptional regulator [Candidatus Neomarinimicrobiota bacterium]MBT4282546.1 TetR/AcrR family transcriptional regulator [Candidatus Neomarinimicrobiota bacterium]
MNQNKQDKRKEQILDAALSVIVKNGYERSRMDDIVLSSQLSKGAIYHYYKSKKEVYLSLVDHWVKNYNAGFIDNVEQHSTASEQLKGLFDFFMDQFEKDPNAFKILVEFWSLSGRDSDFNKKLQNVYSEFLEYIVRIIQKGVDSGEFKNVNPQITALSILINIEGINWFTLFEKSGVEAHEYISTISEFILSGVKKD